MPGRKVRRPGRSVRAPPKPQPSGPSAEAGTRGESPLSGDSSGPCPRCSLPGWPWPEVHVAGRVSNGQRPVCASPRPASPAAWRGRRGAPVWQPVKAA